MRVNIIIKLNNHHSSHRYLDCASKFASSFPPGCWLTIAMGGGYNEPPLNC